MQKRLPQAHAFANSSAKISVMYRSGGRHRILEISPGVAGGVFAFMTVLAIVYAAAAGYLIFKDDILRSTLAGQARMQYAYEDRIAQLRAQIDRVASRQLIDQDTVESKLHELISRQVQLESRHALVAKLSEEATRVGVRAPEAKPNSASRHDTTPTGSFQSFAPAQQQQPAQPLPSIFQQPRAKPLPDAATIRMPQPIDELRNDRQSSLVPVIDRRAVPGIIERAQANSRELAERQMAVLRGIETSAANSARRFKSILDQTGLNQQRFAKALARPAAAQTAMGGPLVPVTNAEAAAFERSLVAASNHLQDSERLSTLMRTLPVRRPLGREHETTSGFGARVDPFTRGMAMHTGLDFRAASGTPIRATAEGKVVESGWVGGYGRMVEIDHGHGITTRYAHMSAIEVANGDAIRRGQIIGYVGSSGRSTGPHLHYEVRIDDDAADPMLFLKAGERGSLE